ncbi:MAG: 50S ribosomal protein L3 [Candidatus Moranbacteria bacterium]|nr:50S ribosomal protein L3 [Candidatus Moranbacteria bacterium]
MKFLIGKKLGMTTLFDEEKGALNVTLIECAPNKVSRKLTEEKNGYSAIQLTTEKTSRKNAVSEFRVDRNKNEEAKGVALKELEAIEEGSTLFVDQFSVGEKVHITGTTKAKGFQGVVKRYNFRGAPASHGRKHDMRKPGSIGATFPEHVIKGRRMAGRMGGDKMTVQNLQVVYVNTEEGLLGVKGAVPGVNGRIVKIVGA